MILDQDSLSRSPDEVVSLALSAGVRFIQYRCKHGSRRAIYDTSSRLVHKVRHAGCLFIVNDHTDIAAAVDADGVHLGQDDLPIEYARKLLGKGKIIGISTHSLEQAKAARDAGADYIGFGPIFATTTKDAGPAKGIETLGLIKRSVSIPLIAIGGITHANVTEVITAGADGVAVISAILTAKDIKGAAEEMIKNIRTAEAKRHRTLFGPEVKQGE